MKRVLMSVFVLILSLAGCSVNNPNISNSKLWPGDSQQAADSKNEKKILL